MNRRDVLRAAALAPLAASMTRPALATDWPTREITFITPDGAGGGGDLTARALMRSVQAKLGVPIVVKNVTGANGATALMEIVNSKPDGYTAAACGVIPYVVTPRISALPVKPLESMDIVAQFLDTLSGIAVPANSPVKTIDDLIALGKTRRVNYSASFVSNVLAMFQLAKITGADFNWVRTSTVAEAVTQAAGGHSDAVINSQGGMGSLLQSGGLRLIASASDVRWPDYPDVRTIRESGYNAANISNIGVAVPKGVPEAARKRFEDAIAESMKEPALLAELRKLGFAPNFKTGPDYLRSMADAEKEIVATFVEAGIIK